MNVLQRWTFVAAVFALLTLPAHAGIYQASSGITAIAVSTDGTVFIRFVGLPDHVCQNDVSNNGWVMIPPASAETIKTLAKDLYINNKFVSLPIRLETSGCSGAYENVTALYSPGG